jgi:hypothetical protein
MDHSATGTMLVTGGSLLARKIHKKLDEVAVSIETAVKDRKNGLES